MNYRSEIDGLRAIAVSAVILAHAGVKFFSGGYIGVDIFFVISGYLITSHILSDLQAGRLSFSAFYLRRLRRLLPALYLVLAVTVPAAWFMLMPDEFELYAKSLIGSVTYVANMVFWRNTNYFAPNIDEMPLIHIWSLAVEEQFYIFFPLIAFIIHRIASRRIFISLFLISLASLLIADYGSRHSPVANFYLLPSRVWEFGVGALCAIAIFRCFTLRSSVWSLAGLAAIGVAVVGFDETTRHPSLVTLLPVLGTALVILSPGPNQLGNRILSLRPVVFVGLISYSLYLWHQPIFAFARIRYEVATPLQFALPILLVIGLSVLSWRYVERPFRHNPGLTRPRAFGGVSIPIALTLVAAGVVFLREGISQTRLPPEVLAIFDGGRDEKSANCHWQSDHPLKGILKTCVFGEGHDHMLIVGDSHAGTLVTAFTQAAKTWPDVSITSIHAEGCAPMRGLYRIDGNSQTCHLLMDALLTPETLRPYSTIIMVARWPMYYEGTGFANGDGGEEDIRFAPVDTRPYRISRFPGSDDEQRKARVGQKIRDGIQDLLNMGKTVIFVEAVPEVGWDVARRAARHLLLHDARLDELSTPQAAYEARVRGYQREIDKISNPRFLRVPTATLFCNLPTAPHRCDAIENTALLYSDTNHLSTVGARRLVDLVMRSRPEAKQSGLKAALSQ